VERDAEAIRALRAAHELHPFYGVDRLWHYLAVVLYLKTRRVVGWRLGTRHTSELTHEALEVGDYSKLKDISELHEKIALGIYYYNTKRIHTTLKMSPAAYAASLMHLPVPKEKTECCRKLEVDTAIKEEDLEQQVIDEISKYTIHPEFAQWALDTLKENNDIEANLHSKTRENLQYELEKLQSNRTELVRMRLDKMIDDSEYENLKSQIEKDLLVARDRLDQNEKNSDNWIIKAESIFDFAVNAKRRFETGDFDTKREIIMGLGADLLLKDKKIQFKPVKYLVPIQKFYPKLEKEYLRLELDTTPESQRSEIQKDAVASLSSVWQGRQDLNLRPLVLETSALPTELLPYKIYCK
jgi:hypothetical protein